MPMVNSLTAGDTHIADTVFSMYRKRLPRIAVIVPFPKLPTRPQYRQDTLFLRAKETREAAYTNAAIVEGLVMAQLALAQKDPTQASKAGPAMKVLSLAASALERLHATKLSALGLDEESPLADEMPVLTFRDLTKEELEAFKARDVADEDSDLGIPIVAASTETVLAVTEIGESDDVVMEGDEIEDDAIIIEGEEPEASEEPTKPRPLRWIFTVGD